MIIHNVEDKMSRVDWSKVSRDDGIRKIIHIIIII